MFDQEHEVDSAQSRQAFPHAVHVLLAIVVRVKVSGGVQVMVVRVMVVIVIPMRLKSRKQNASTTLQLLLCSDICSISTQSSTRRRFSGRKNSSWWGQTVKDVGLIYS